MHHIMGHVDEGIQALIGFTLNQCRICNQAFANAFLLRAHMEKVVGSVYLNVLSSLMGRVPDNKL